MQDYEYKDEGGRFLCRLHHRIRCDECHYVSDLRDENKRYREAIQKAIAEFNQDEHQRGMAELIKVLEGEE